MFTGGGLWVEGVGRPTREVTMSDPLQHYDEPEPVAPGGTVANSPTPQAIRAVRHTRINAAWVAWICGTILLILLLVFILQNLNRETVHLFFWTVHLPLGVSLLIAAIAGVVVTVAIGGARIYQLRRATKKALGQQNSPDAPLDETPQN